MSPLLSLYVLPSTERMCVEASELPEFLVLMLGSSDLAAILTHKIQIRVNRLIGITAVIITIF